MNLPENITKLLRLEALVFFIGVCWAYYLTGASWLIFSVFILAPDIFMLGYMKNSKLGAVIYNMGHSYIIPFVLLGLYALLGNQIYLVISIIWMAHISMDRMFGFGLKLDSGFKHTHLGEMGKNK